MESYSYLLWLAIILISTKVLGLVSEHAHMPQVVGALLAVPLTASIKVIFTRYIWSTYRDKVE
jgi:Kef-type K+ transport system membrane component KefB